MEAGEYGLTHGTCFLACRLELDAVAGLLWISWCFLGGADFSSVFFFDFFFLRTHTACCKYEAASCLIYLSTSTDCESCTRPISANNPGSMEAGEYGLTRGTCFLACGLELDAIAGLLWISWCVLVGRIFLPCFFFRFFFRRAHKACCKYEATLPHLPLYQ